MVDITPDEPKWEFVAHNVERMVVPGGWLYKVVYYDFILATNDRNGVQIFCTVTFVPGPVIRASGR